MKPIATISFLLIAAIIVAPLGACAQAPAAPARATLSAPDSLCRSQLKNAADSLSGKNLTLADDAFTKVDTLALSTVGQSASGRMLPPRAILRLRLTADGCALTMDGQKGSVLLKGCNCTGLSAK